MIMSLHDELVIVTLFRIKVVRIEDDDELSVRTAERKRGFEHICLLDTIYELAL